MYPHRVFRSSIPWLLTAGVLLGLLVRARVLNGLLDFTTGMLLIAAICVAGFALTEVAMRLGSCRADTKNQARLFLTTVSLLAVVVELTFRFVFVSHVAYMEQNGHPSYVPRTAKTAPTWFHVFASNANIYMRKEEFDHFRTTNSLGLAEREIETDKPPGEYRVVAIGDSFTEGVGTSYDSSWVRVLEGRLQAVYPHTSIRAVNAGVSGSDVFFAYVLLKGRLLDLKPDLVIVAINDSDVLDIAVRGGKERFQQDGSTLFTNAGPSWEWLYGISYTFRHIIHDLWGYDGQLIKRKESEATYGAAITQIMSAIDDFVDLAQEHGFQLLIVTHPHEWEVRTNMYGLGFDKVVDRLRHLKGLSALDLLEHFTGHGIMTDANLSDFYWPIDGHHNGRGYQAMGEAIAQAVINWKAPRQGNRIVTASLHADKRLPVAR